MVLEPNNQVKKLRKVIKAFSFHLNAVKVAGNVPIKQQHLY